MGIFTGWKLRKQKAFVARAEDLAGSIQVEIYKHAEAVLLSRLGGELAGGVAASIANHVCRFGYVNPAHAMGDVLSLSKTERPTVLRSFGETFKSNATGVLILLGAAWEIDITNFKEHMSSLAREGFAKVGRETPNVSQSLTEAQLTYMYTLTLVESNHAGA